MSAPTSWTLRVQTARAFKPLLCRARYKAAFGGRGSGKSHFFARQCILEHVDNPDRNTVCIREVQRSLKESVKRLLEDYIKKLGVESYFTITETAIVSKRGTGRIVFMGLSTTTAESIKSLEGYDCAWVEEAHTLSAKSLELLRPTLRKPGSEIWFSWNPESDDDPVDEFFRCNSEKAKSAGQQPPANAVIVEANYWDNPWFTDELKAEMELDRARDTDAYDHTWCGGYRRLSHSRIFHNWRVEEFETPIGAGIHHRFGVDFGYSTTPLAALRCHRIDRTLYIDHDVERLGVATEDTPDVLMQLPEIELWPSRADSARPETIDHCQRHGIPKMIGATKGPNSIVEGIEFIKSLDIIVHKRCVATARALRRYSWKTNKKTGEVLPIPDEHDDDIPDALRYALETDRRSGAPTERLRNKPVVSAWRRK